MAVTSPLEPSTNPLKSLTARVLLSVREPAAQRALAEVLAQAAVDTTLAASSEATLVHLEAGAHTVVIAEVSTIQDATQWLTTLLERAPAATIVALTPLGQPELGVQAVRSGATDFIRMPIDRDEVTYVFTKSLRIAEFAEAEAPSSIRIAATTPLIGGSTAMLELQRTLSRVASGIATVLVRGESGVGKELVARRVHEQSPRRHGPFVKVHCGALPDQLLESELFGYEKGAFTGAVTRKPGRVELACGGTLFLDEIGDITPAAQVKLLKVLQDREYEPLGSTRSHKADVRFVTATHRDLQAMVAKGEFREDLFYRLNVVSLWVPPLRTRPDDIEPLTLHFCEATARANGRPSILFDVGALDLLKQQPWPGNVRQLQNFVERLVVLADGPRISSSDVQRELSRQSGALGFAVASGYVPKLEQESAIIDLSATLRNAEKRALEKALRRAGGNRGVAARLLGVSVRTLYYKLEEHQLS